MKTNFKEVKNDALNSYNGLLEIIKQAGLEKNEKLKSSLESLKNQAERIKEDKFCLLIAGEAKSGKSTFINAYLGTEILPMDVRQCTSSVVVIGYGQEFCLTAMYADGRKVKIKGEVAIKEFLKKNAALDDEYRDIPVTTINNEVIVKYKEKKIAEKEIKELLEGVRRENIHRLPEEQYENKIRAYIKNKQEHWKDVVVKMEISYPFEDPSMRGIRVIDSPGINAAGKVGDVTEKYIKSADAIMFLRPITGVAIEATGFKEFLESTAVDRNKNAMFLVLTRIASESDDTIDRAYEEFLNMFGTMKTDNRHGIVKEQIIPVDSKAEMYFNMFKNMSTPEIAEYIKQLNLEKKADPFLRLAWADAVGDKDQLQRELKKISGFNRIDEALNKFGRKAQYIVINEFLGRILSVYEKVEVEIQTNIKIYTQKLKNPEKLAVEISETTAELRDIENRMNEKVDEITVKYAAGRNGIIQQEADKVMSEFRDEIKKLDASSRQSIDALEKASFRKIDRFIEFENDLQKKVVTECNEALKVALSDKEKIEFTTLEPDFTQEMVDEIKENVKKDSKESQSYTTGRTFKRTETISVFSQQKYYKLFSNSISEKLEEIKNQAVRDLRSFVSKTVTKYTNELAKSAKATKDNLEKIKNEKITAEENQKIIEEFKMTCSMIEPLRKEVKVLKGGIDSNV